MKTPRLALLAFLALAPLANAAPLPTWPVVEEGPRSWARVFFTVGKENVSLRCRWKECRLENKTQSNLYKITPVGKATPTKVTIYKMVPRSKWNPAYYTDGPYEKVPEVINANAQPYSSELSNFKLDNSGAALVVVQGTNKYPARTDINETQFNSYDQLKVSPPTKMIDDVVKPVEAPKPGTDPRTNPRTPPAGGTAKWWCDPKTGEKYSAPRGRKGSTRLASQTAECKKAGGAITPTVPVVTTPAGPSSAIALTVGEQTWLDRGELDLYSRKVPAPPAKVEAAHLEAFRKKVAANIAEIPGAAAKYEAALTTKATAATIDASLPEIWGGKDNKTVVGLTGDRKDIQLSPEEYKALEALPLAAGATVKSTETYVRARVGADGRTIESGVVKPGVYNPKTYDPIALHRSVVAARAAAGKTPGKEPPKEQETERSLLTDAEIKLLTPQEKALYDSYIKAATKGGKFDPTDKNLLDTAVMLRKRMNSEVPPRSQAKAPPSSADMTQADFDKLTLAQKRQFCVDYPVEEGVISKDARAGSIDNQADALKGAKNSTGDAVAPKTAPAADTKWPRKDRINACRKLPPENVGEINPTGPKPKEEGAVANLTNGKDAEIEAKKKNTWITAPLITDAAKGALIGLVVGTLFGPLGLILGPIIGAALYYGASKLAEKVKGGDE